MKKIPAKYCIHCEEKLASREHCPYCSKWCKDMAKEQGK